MIPCPTEKSVEYLLTCSKEALEHLELNNMNFAKERRKLAIEAMEEAVKAEAAAKFIALIRQYGEALIAGELVRKEQEDEEPPREKALKRLEPAHWRAVRRLRA